MFSTGKGRVHRILKSSHGTAYRCCIHNVSLFVEVFDYQVQVGDRGCLRVPNIELWYRCAEFQENCAHACVRFLSATPPAIAKSMEAAQSIVRDGKEAGDVVRRIRALFKKTLAAKVPLNLNEIISEVLQLLSTEITRRGVIVEIDFEKQLPLVLCDRIQLQQLNLNLLLNAMEAMDPITDLFAGELTAATTVFGELQAVADATGVLASRPTSPGPSTPGGVTGPRYRR